MRAAVLIHRHYWQGWVTFASGPGSVEAELVSARFCPAGVELSLRARDGEEFTETLGDLTPVEYTPGPKPSPETVAELTQDHVGCHITLPSVADTGTLRQLGTFGDAYALELEKPDGLRREYLFGATAKVALLPAERISPEAVARIRRYLDAAPPAVEHLDAWYDEDPDNRGQAYLLRSDLQALLATIEGDHL